MNYTFYARLLCSGVALLVALGVRAQVPAFAWAVGAEAPTTYDQQAQNRAIATDAAGNTYVTGIFRKTMTLGNITLTAENDYDLFVASLDPAGHYRWAVRAGGNDWDISNGLALDAAGNVYITGYFESSTARFGTITLNQPGVGANLFVAKLSPTGVWLQATAPTLSAGQSSNSFLYLIGTALTVDVGGNVYVTGGFNGGPQFGSTTLSCYGGYKGFVAKLTPAGTWEWAVAGGGCGYDFGQSIAVDAAGSAYVTGSFEGYTATFGTTVLTRAGFSKDLFVARLDPAGRWQWATHATAATAAYGRGIVLDPAGNAYVTGAVAGQQVRLGSLALNSTDNSYDLFVAKLTPAGAWQWAVRGGSPQADAGAGLVRDASGELTVAGSFSQTASFGQLPALTAVGKADLVVTRLGSDGSWHWALGGGSTGDDHVAGVALGSDGTACIAGSFESPSLVLGPSTVPGGTKYYDYYADRGFVSSVADIARRSPVGVFNLWPNPSTGTVWATGMAEGQPVEVFDCLGRRVAVDARPVFEASGLILPPLAPGVYVVRSGSQTQRLVRQ
ncbi:hypothetical protein GCM10022409_10540 [Hymenobacter glaciei]|uniref:Secretion system C-terminal sorting domain-containing protein n=1 Tax=Hymenobacter glaciei TaxID=877209 RepID=A0ABP7TM26_9BACT